MSAADLAAERARFRERQEQMTRENRPRIILRMAAPGASLEEIRAIVDTHYPRLDARERSELVDRVLEAQQAHRGRRLDPGSVAVQRPEPELGRKPRAARAQNIPDLTAWETEESPAPEVLQEETETVATAAADRESPTVPKAKEKKNTLRRLSPEDRARMIAWIALQLRDYPNMIQAEIHRGLAEGTGVPAVSYPTFQQLYLRARGVRAELEPRDTLETVARRVLQQFPGRPAAPAVQESSPAEEQEQASPAPAADEEPAAPAASEAPATVRCHGCGEPLPVGEQCDNTDCPQSRVMRNRRPWTKDGAAEALASNGDLVHRITFEPGPPNGKSAAEVVEKAVAEAIRSMPPPAEQFRGGGFLQTSRGTLRYRVRKDGTYRYTLDYDGPDALTFTELVGLGHIALLGSEVARA